MRTPHAFTLRILHEVYADFMENVLALPVLRGIKTEAERFAGALNTFAVESLMRDGKALQMGTSHELGQNFAKAFDIQFQGRDAKVHHGWTTSWGVSTRMVGGLIMGHGDDAGLRVPPNLAPVQVNVMVVKDTDEVQAAAKKIYDELKGDGVRVRLDHRADVAFGRRAVDAELKGYPVRIEIGPRDLKNGEATLVSRVEGIEADRSARDARRGRRRRAPRRPGPAVERGPGVPRVAHGRRRHRRGGRRGRPDRLRPPALGCLRCRGRAKAAESAVTVRVPPARGRLRAGLPG